ncbi:DUF2971 domain-containing protein [Vibrio chagasii]|uniref:DUF2971 domain-containing protein n=1 Tax=Vibrio chagasii TaxID=170679 RepID=UPI001EFEE3DB|nr:DUF2971 domain-containing protein [Vibrio chagasii]MCG9672640.1 DUF2971 domain-containing protein [Vibrio chagasii]
MLYKFLPDDRVDVISDLRIRFSPLDSLNDPYEALPSIDLSSLREQEVLKVNDRLDSLWERTADEEKTEDNWQILSNGRQELVAHITNRLGSSEVRTELMGLFGDKFGILSLSRTKQNLLMWSHYSSAMTGYVIGFDESHEFFHRPTLFGEPTKPSPVKYSESRMQFNVHSGDKLDLLCHKPLDWAYEQEERLFLSLMDDEFKTEHKDNFGNSVYLYPIPPEAIHSVYIGARASSEIKRKIQLAIRTNNLDCKIYLGDLSETEYKVEFSEVELKDLIN